MDSLTLYFALSASGVIGLAILAVAALKGFTVWIDLKRAELATIGATGTSTSPSSHRIEIADMRERIRKLEAIAAGVDL